MYPERKRSVKSEPFGAYGLRIAGISSDRLQRADPGWPELTVRREEGLHPDPGRPGEVTVDDTAMRVWIGDGGSIDLDRATLHVRVRAAKALSDDALVHPYLTLPAAVASRWLGRHALHGGVFVHDGGAWGLLADKEGGKSSTLAGVLRRGHAVLTDDLLVLDGLDALAGPRVVDLRGEAAATLGGESLGLVGARTRWRLTAADAPPSSRMRGFVHLAWGPELAVTPLDAGERLNALIAQCVIRPEPGDALELLELAALPAWRLERPRRIEALDACVDQLLAVVGG
jgi:hypothetical protein